MALSIEQRIDDFSERIIDTMAEGLIIINPEGRIIKINKSFEAMTGYTIDDIRDQPCRILECDICETKQMAEEGFWCKLFSVRQVLRKKCRIRRKNGTYLETFKNASLLRDNDGNIVAAIEILSDISELNRLDDQVYHLSKQLESESSFFGLVGEAPNMQEMFDLIRRAAKSDAPVIIFGESGTGKECVAQAIHRLSRRKDQPFVQLNCGALNEAILESELFGHVKGAFTGAYRHRIGRFEAADKGNIFLDEIGETPLSIQVKLLRVLELNQIERVGDHEPIDVDVRLITATNKDLNKLIVEGAFREDFFFRINVIPITVPPLRQRRSDIPLLVEHFIEQLNKRTGKRITGLSSDAMQRFMDYHWPGNVRELKSAIEYAFVVADAGKLDTIHLPGQLSQKHPVMVPAANPVMLEVSSEKEALIEALRATSGNQSKAAELLQVSRVTVWNRMKKYGIDLKKGALSNS